MVEKWPRRIELPAFDLPFEGTDPPITAEVVEQTCQWAKAVGLAPAAVIAKLRRDGVVNVGPRLVPAAAAPVSRLVSDWTLFLIAVDDEFDECELGTQPTLAAEAADDIVAAFRGEPAQHARTFPQLRGAAEASADLGRRFAAIAPSADWLRRFTHHAQAHLGSKALEAEQRATGATLDVLSYIHLRRITAAPYTYSALAELAAGVTFDPQVRASAAWYLLLDAFADAWIGIQDICSCGKEVAGGDNLNLAVAMSHSAGGPLQQGIGSAYEWTCMRSADFAVQRKLFPASLALDAATQQQVGRFADALADMLGGHLAWNSQDNPRYTQYAAHAQAS